MITEKMIFVYRNLQYTDAGVLFIPTDLSLEDLTQIQLSGGELLWFVGGIYYLIPKERIENITSVFEDATKIEGHLVDPMEIRLSIQDMQEVGPIILPLL